MGRTIYKLKKYGYRSSPITNTDISLNIFNLNIEKSETL